MEKNENNNAPAQDNTAGVQGELFERYNASFFFGKAAHAALDRLQSNYKLLHIAVEEDNQTSGKYRARRHYCKADEFESIAPIVAEIEQLIDDAEQEYNLAQERSKSLPAEEISPMITALKKLALQTRLGAIDKLRVSLPYERMRVEDEVNSGKYHIVLQPLVGDMIEPLLEDKYRSSCDQLKQLAGIQLIYKD